jgi:hypothetical protein
MIRPSACLGISGWIGTHRLHHQLCGSGQGLLEPFILSLLIIDAVKTLACLAQTLDNLRISIFVRSNLLRFAFMEIKSLEIMRYVSRTVVVLQLHQNSDCTVYLLIKY